MPLQDYFRMKNIFGNNPVDWNSGRNPSQGLPSGVDENIDVYGDNNSHVHDSNSDKQINIRGDNNSHVHDSEFTPQTRDTDAFRKLISEYPSHEGTEPSLLRRIGSAFIGFNEGSDAQRKYLDDPFTQKLADWKNRIAPTEQEANLERFGNANIRQGTYQGRRADIAESEVSRKTEQGNTRLDQNQQKIDQNQEKIDHVMSRQDITDSEKLALTNKYKQEQIQARGEIDKSLQGTRGSQRLEQIGAKGDVDKDIQDLRGSQSLEQIGARGTEARGTRATIPGGSGATSVLPSQQKVGQQLRANKAKQEHPEWSNYITTNPNTGMVEVAPPSDNWYTRGPAPEVRKQILDYLGQGVPSAAPAVKPSETVKPPAATVNKPKPSAANVESGYVKVADASGKVIAQIPEADAARLNKAKYHVVQ